MEALDLTMGDLFGGTNSSAVVARYTYTDVEGNPVYRVVRSYPKSFYQERLEDGEWKPGLRSVSRVPYRLPETLKAIREGHTIYLVEGEKDADNLAEVGVHATTLLGGAGKWREEYQSTFKGAKVCIIADDDEAGRLGAAKVRIHLQHVAESVDLAYPREGKDITDHLNAGFDIAEVVKDVPDLSEFTPFDWEDYETTETRWLYEPYLPAGGRVLVFGPAGSLKSLWSLWVAARLSQDGRNVAYFSLEMTATDLTSRLNRLHPDPNHFKVYTRLQLTNPQHAVLLVNGLKGTDLVVVDSFSAAYQSTGYDQNEAIAMLDNDVFQPLAEQGTTVLILDNVGQPMLTDKGPVKPTWARGASAKADKMEVSIHFDRPVSNNNYKTTLTVKKMRLDKPTPSPLTIETEKGTIDFYRVIDGVRQSAPIWPRRGEEMPTDTLVATPDPEPDPEVTTKVVTSTEGMTLKEKLALARLKGAFGAISEETLRSIPEE
jgi:KaiC/GvpD/RAD55 family RecA-like ATPase/5S rRNA maturation endonuclease (ribonuclease M5)